MAEWVGKPAVAMSQSWEASPNTPGEGVEASGHGLGSIPSRGPKPTHMLPGSLGGLWERAASPLLSASLLWLSWTRQPQVPGLNSSSSPPTQIPQVLAWSVVAPQGTSGLPRHCPLLCHNSLPGSLTGRCDTSRQTSHRLTLLLTLLQAEWTWTQVLRELAPRDPATLPVLAGSCLFRTVCGLLEHRTPRAAAREVTVVLANTPLACSPWSLWSSSYMDPHHHQGRSHGCQRQTSGADSKLGRREQELEEAAGRDLRDKLGRKQTWGKARWKRSCSLGT